MGEWRKLAREGLEAFNSGRPDWDGFDERIEFVDPMLPKPAHGLAEVRAYVEGFLTAFPDANLTVRDAVESEDAVALEVTLTGTHLGPAQGPAGLIPATGRKVKVDSCQIARIAGGKIVHYRTYVDTMQLLSQLGLMPAPASHA